MTLKRYLLGIAISTLFCVAAFFLVLVYIDPADTGIVGFVCFYLSLFFSFVGLFTLIGFYLRIWFSGNEIIFAHVAPSFRQAIFFAIIIVGSLMLQSFRLLTWWDALLFVLSIILLEFFFMSRSSNKSFRRA
ncbi:hypothetical protein KKH43_00730 [Patescibacteria group bacterium]|nr:hypothetical protein [Patescibacteria group bacterium]